MEYAGNWACEWLSADTFDRRMWQQGPGELHKSRLRPSGCKPLCRRSSTFQNVGASHWIDHDTNNRGLLRMAEVGDENAQVARPPRCYNSHTWGPNEGAVQLELQDWQTFIGWGCGTRCEDSIPLLRALDARHLLIPTLRVPSTELEGMYTKPALQLLI